MEHTLFSFFLKNSSLVSVPLLRNTGNASIAHLAETHKPPLRGTAPHDHVHARPCLFISRHGSIAISCLVVVFTCQVMRCPSELMASPHISLWRRGFVSSAPNELLPSNFSPSCHVTSTHVWHVCNWLSELPSC